MRISGKKKKPRGVNVEVSKKAHAAMLKEANKFTPRKTLREINNLRYNVPEHE